MDEFGNLCGEGGARQRLSSKRYVELYLLGSYSGFGSLGFGVRASAHVRLHEVSDNEAHNFSAQDHRGVTTAGSLGPTLWGHV